MESRTLFIGPNDTIFRVILPCGSLTTLRVIETSTDEDLSGFSRYLNDHHIPHRVFEERGALVLEVALAEHADDVRLAYERWRQAQQSGSAWPGRSNADRAGGTHNPVDDPAQDSQLSALWPRLAAAKITLVCIALAALIYPLVDSIGRADAWVSTLIFNPQQALTWFTPALLHFSAAHLVLNCAAVWEMGRRLESGLSFIFYPLVLVFMAVASNWAQFLWSGGVLFGGLSGVAYGLLGALLVLSRLEPGQPNWKLPAGIETGLLIFLVLFSTGFTESFGLHVANAAHWGGLVSGLMVGLLWHYLPGRRSL